MICPNCQTEYIGNFCPSCGQSAKMQRFTVKNALMSTLEVWGMGNRSLPRTLLHLFTRPGYMIGDYLDGKRMPFFPPVKMLFVLCIFFALVTTIRDGNNVQDAGEKVSEQKMLMKTEAGKKDPTEKILFTFNGKVIKIEDFIDGVKATAEWLDEHKAIELICLHCFFMFFSWRVFRKSPVRPATTLAENFFSQVYISGQMMAASIVYVLIFGNTKSTFYPLPWWALFGLFVWDFKQLFGFNWRSTIRRTILIHLFSIIVFILICVVVISILGYATGSFQSMSE